MTSETVLFVHPEYINNRFVGYTRHYGCSSIIGHLRRHGIRSESFLGDRRWTPRRVAEELAARRPRLVGFSCYDVNFYLIRLIVDEFRRLDRETVVLLGGPSASFSWKLLLEHCPGADGCVAGDGEDVVLDLLRQDTRRDHLPEVEGFFRRGDPEGRPRNLQGNINEYPSPYVSGEIPGAIAPSVGLFSSRGCYYRCTFCNFSALSNYRVRAYTADRLLEEISRIAHDRRGELALVPFYDDFFTMMKRRTREVCQGIIDNGLNRHLAFSCQTRVDSVDRDVLALMREAGFRIISFGIESGSPKVLRLMKKVRLGKKVEQKGYEAEKKFLETLRRGVAEARDLGFRVTGSIILGLPGEGPEEGRETLEFVRSLDLSAYSHNYLNVFPGTELFRTHAEAGIRVEPSITILPFNTVPAYDVVQVGYLKENADVGHQKRIGVFIREMMDLESRSLLSAAPGDVIYLAKAEPGPVGEAFWDAAAAVSHPDSYVLLRQRDFQPEWARRNFEAIYARHLPILEQKIVSDHGDVLDFFLSNRGGWGPATRTFTGRVVRQAFTDFLSPPPAGGAEPHNVIYTLHRVEDRELFVREAERLERDGAYVLPEPMLGKTACVERLCRFGLGCPLRRNGAGNDTAKATYRGDDGGWRTYCGLRLAGDDPAAALRRLQGEVEARRGCAACEAGDTCSRCPALGELAEEDYCRMMRRGAAVAEYARLLDVAFSRAQTCGHPDAARKVVFKNFGAGSRETPFIYQGPPGTNGTGGPHGSVRPDVTLMLYRGNPIFHVPGSRELIDVSVPLAEVAEAIHCGADAAAMEGYFAQKYDLGPGEAPIKLTQAVSMLAEYGILNTRPC